MGKVLGKIIEKVIEMTFDIDVIKVYSIKDPIGRLWEKDS